MTNTDTADVDGHRRRRSKALARAGSELVRITVDRDEAARAVPHIRDALDARGVDVPLIGDFHYIGHKLLTENPGCAEALAKYRINPGNVGFREKRDRQFSTMIEVALKYDQPVRIGVNWGSLDQELLVRLMDENAASAEPKTAAEVTQRGDGRLGDRKRAPRRGARPAADRIILSCKVSEVQSLIAVYSALAERCNYALHLGLTEAGMGSKGIVASTAGMAVLLQQGIGDTIRVSLTPEPGGDRTQEVIVAQQILQVIGLRTFMPLVTACPGCGRTTSTVFQKLAGDIQDHIRAAHARLVAPVPGRRDDDGGGDGLHRQRPGRKQARRHRHQPARHRRGAGRAGVHRRPQGDDPARPRHRHRVPGDRRGLRPPALSAAQR